MKRCNAAIQKLWISNKCWRILHSQNTTQSLENKNRVKVNFRLKVTMPQLEKTERLNIVDHWYSQLRKFFRKNPNLRRQWSLIDPDIRKLHSRPLISSTFQSLVQMKDQARWWSLKLMKSRNLQSHVLLLLNLQKKLITKESWQQHRH